MKLENRVIGGRYKIIQQLGKGGNAAVFLCQDQKLQKSWAVKEVTEPTDAERGMELELLKTISCNAFPRIVDVIKEDKSVFLVMDYVEGITLKEKMKRQLLTEADVLPWALEIAKGIRYLHQMNPSILYMDCKPDNIMLTHEGEIRLIDLGSVYVCSREIKRQQRISGTRFFAPKEQYARKKGDLLPDVRTDIYAFGMTLYYLLTGGRKEYRKNGKLCARMANPAISRGMNHIIEKCTMENPKLRYQSMEEIMYQLSHIKEVGRWKLGKEMFYQFIILLGKIGCTMGILVSAIFYQLKQDGIFFGGMILLTILFIVSCAKKRVTVCEIKREIFCGNGKRILGTFFVLIIIAGEISISSYAAENNTADQNANAMDFQTTDLSYEDEDTKQNFTGQYKGEDTELAVTLYDEKNRKILIQDGAAWGIEQDIHILIPVDEIREYNGKIMILYEDEESGEEKSYSFRCYKK